jgi:hypothetical protein
MLLTAVYTLQSSVLKCTTLGILTPLRKHLISGIPLPADSGSIHTAKFAIPTYTALNTHSTTSDSRFG